MKLVEVAGIAFEATTGAPMVVLQEQDAPHRLLPIFIGAPEAASIATTVSGQAPARPLTHDLMAALLHSLDAQIDLAEVTEFRDGAFFAQLTVRGADGEHRLDTRPSDAIAMALRLGAPVLVSEAVLDEVGTLPVEMFEEDAIDEAVEEFRSFLDDVEPLDFGDRPGRELPSPAADAGHPRAEPGSDGSDDEPTEGEPA